MSMTIHLLLVDDRPLVQIGWQHLLDAVTDIECIGIVALEEEILPQIEALQPNVVVLSDRYPPEIVTAIRAQHPRVRIIILGDTHRTDTLDAMRHARGDGYVLLKEPPNRLITAIRHVAQGYPYLAPPVAMQTLHSIVEHDTPPCCLTEREKDVLHLIAQGRTNTYIARQLGISKRTVAFHVENLLTKLNATNRTEAVVNAIRQGWLSLER